MPGLTSHLDDVVLVRHVNRLRSLRVAAAILITGASVWLFSSLYSGIEARRLTVPIEKPVVGVPAVTRSEQRDVDWNAFDAPIWNPRPTPQIAAPPPPPPPLRLKLLAVVVSSDRVSGSESDVRVSRSAMIYDPDVDEVVTVREGERIAGRVVKSIEAQRIVLVEGTIERTVELEDAQSMRRPMDDGRSEVAGGA